MASYSFRAIACLAIFSIAGCTSGNPKQAEFYSSRAKEQLELDSSGRLSINKYVGRRYSVHATVVSDYCNQNRSPSICEEVDWIDFRLTAEHEGLPSQFRIYYDHHALRQPKLGAGDTWQVDFTDKGELISYSPIDKPKSLKSEDESSSDQ